MKSLIDYLLEAKKTPITEDYFHYPNTKQKEWCPNNGISFYIWWHKYDHKFYLKQGWTNDGYHDGDHGWFCVFDMITDDQYRYVYQIEYEEQMADIVEWIHTSPLVFQSVFDDKVVKIQKDHERVEKKIMKHFKLVAKIDKKLNIQNYEEYIK